MVLTKINYGGFMKLDYKKTILVGFAFFLISAFWGAYDAIVPLLLTNHFGLPQDWSGAIMSLDNVLAVFMLPIFGALSDKVNTRYGRRTPFVFVGTVLAVVAFICLSLIDNIQLANVLETNANIPALRAEAAAMLEEANAAKDATLRALAEARLKEIDAMTLEITLQKIGPLVAFIGILLFTLIAMATFRSPAVALMPDVTIKPLRSKGNAVINLMGTAGGIIVLIFGIVFATSKKLYYSYMPYVIAVCGVMLAGLIIFLFTVKEKKWASEMEEDTAKLGLEEKEEETADKRKLTKPEKISLILILASVALWYIGYNSITSKYSVYATNVLGFDYNLTLIIAQGAAIVSYIPVGMLASKIGRRRSILIGVAMLASAFLSASFINSASNPVFMYFVFILAGMGWATINVNSFPMVVELARGGDVGKYTGYYYTASMAAQIVTPILSGVLIERTSLGWSIFFPYAALFVAFSFVTMYFVKHGDAKAEKVSALEALGGVDD